MRSAARRARGSIAKATAALLLLLAGCGTSSPTAPPSNLEPTGYRLESLPEGSTSPDLLVLVAFSGGGMRASAFSYGVLRGLRDADLEADGKPRPLLDEVDVISAVSGGTFTAAYYGLHRERTFSDYERDFLHHDFNSPITLLAAPYIAGSVAATVLNVPTAGQDDRLPVEAIQGLYDRYLFHGATFADLERNARPLILIGAADDRDDADPIFTFTQDNFDSLCLDLSSYPLARAVTAANALPFLFKGVTLENYADDCEGRRRRYGEESPSLLDSFGREFVRRMTGGLASLDDSVNLTDAGTVDNLGLQPLIDRLARMQANGEALRRARLEAVRRVLLISVDGQGRSFTPDEEGAGKNKGTVQHPADIWTEPSDREQLENARGAIDAFVSNLKSARCAKSALIARRPCDDVEGELVYLSLTQISDADLRRRLMSIPTTLTLAADEVDLLIAAGEEAVRTSAPLDQFRRSLATVGPLGGRGL